jgi:hypothetical protein
MFSYIHTVSKKIYKKIYNCIHMNKLELHKSTLDKFWSIYEIEGTVQALSWLETLKYYEEYCQDDVDYICSKLSLL